MSDCQIVKLSNPLIVELSNCRIVKSVDVTACRVPLLCGGGADKNERSSHDADPYDLLYVVGAFDTICKTCQQQYCSAGVWTGQEFDKVRRRLKRTRYGRGAPNFYGGSSHEKVCTSPQH